MAELVTIHIDGKPVQVEAGTNIIEAAKSIGIEIPHYCYHEFLSVAGNCRMCMLEMGTELRDRATGAPVLDETGKPKIGWMPRPQIACATKAANGQHFKTNSPLVADSRKAVMEFLLANHPLDCPICDKAGECHLQEFASEYGRGFSRFEEDKNRKPKRSRIGPRITLDDERCILCGRCIRFCREVLHEDVLGFTQRGSHSTLSIFPGHELTSNYSLNVTDICPVGALTSNDFRFKMRVWFLKRTPSICTESSVGVNTTVWSREGVIYRITPRENPAVNDAWMSDSGRALYKMQDAENRLTHGTVGGTELACELLKAGKIAIVGSAFSSVEEQFLLKKFADKVSAVWCGVLAHSGKSDGFLISADHAPNTRGAILTGLSNGLPTTRLDELKAKIAAGEVSTILTVREDIIAAGISPDDLKGVKIISLSSHSDATTALASIVIAVPTVFERTGSFINNQWRLQRFEQAVPPPQGVQTEIALLNRFLTFLGAAPLPAPTPEAVWAELSAQIPQLNGKSFANLSSLGLPLDASAFINLKFADVNLLHAKS